MLPQNLRDTKLALPFSDLGGPEVLTLDGPGLPIFLCRGFCELHLLEPCGMVFFINVLSNVLYLWKFNPTIVALV